MEGDRAREKRGGKRRGTGGGTGDESPGEKGWEAGGERAGTRILKVAGTGRKQGKFCNISLYFRIDMRQEERTATERGRGGRKRYGRWDVQTPLSLNIVPWYDEGKVKWYPSTG